MIRISVMINNNYQPAEWWLNFVDHHESINKNTRTSLGKSLAEWGLKDVPGTIYIESPDEEHFTIFLLRWS